MDRREWMKLTATGAAFSAKAGYTRPQQPATGSNMNPLYENPIHTGPLQDVPAQLKLFDFQPQSIFKVPATEITKAKYPVIDLHSHGVHSPEAAQEMVKCMDDTGVERSVIFTGAGTPEHFAQARAIYSGYPGRFDLWCSFDFGGINDPGFGPNAIKALEECHRMGAVGVGEISDKGFGLGAHRAAGAAADASLVPGAHAGDPRLDPLWDKAGQLGMPISIHVSDPIWAYQQMNNHNDWLPAAWTWRIPERPGLLGHDGLIASLEHTAQKHLKTIFVACHLIQLDYDLARLGEIFDRHPNLYADLSARVQEISTIPRFTKQFMQKYQDRIVFGTDWLYNNDPLRLTFRTLETADEHFYVIYPGFNHSFWPMNGLDLPDAVLKKIYRDNALQVYERARRNAA